MNAFIIIAAAFANIIGGVQIAPSSYKIIQHQLPVQSQYTTYYPRKSSYLRYATGPTHSYVDNSVNAIFGNIIPGATSLENSFLYGKAAVSNAIRCMTAPPRCIKSPYRSFDGTCNNLQNPIWGAANTRYSRLISPKYGDGYSSPTASVTGTELPNSRLVSLVAFGEDDIADPQFTLVNMQWGQIVTHDMSMLAGSTQSKKHATRCCTPEGRLMEQNLLHKTCYPIVVPKNDPAHSQTNVECINFVRTLTDKDQNCPDTLDEHPAEQLTVVTSYMDLSLVYGNSEAQSRPIRAFVGGRMRVVERRGYEWPPQAENATASCDAQDQDEVCYRTGDVRTNQNPGLAILQIILMREHNRIADVLQELNPHWDDELTFQESRRINIAQFQQITYYEWLPIFLGANNMLKNRLIYKTEPGSYVNDYDITIDPSVLNAHATAAFRYFHSQIEGRLDLISEVRSSTGALRLSDWLNRPAIVEAGDNYDSLTRGLATQPEQLTDINFDPEIKHFLFRRNMPFGGDLRAIDIQRNRDHGLQSYNAYREFCGMRRAQRWEDFLDLLSPKTVETLEALYASVDDVDLTVGGSLEAHVEDTLAGPTFLCILTEQFYRTRVGDRFFFERGNKDTAFSRRQLIELKKATVARLLCDNSNHVHNIQPSAFRRVSKTNEIIPCSSIPRVDLSAWKDLSVGTQRFGVGPLPHPSIQTYFTTPFVPYKK